MVWEQASPLILTLSQNTVAEDLDSALTSLDPARLGISDCIILKCPVGGSPAASDPRTASMLRKRLERPVYLLEYEPKKDVFRLSLLHGPVATRRELTGTEFGSALRTIRQTDLEQVFEKNKSYCWFQSPDTYHFVSPAGDHCSGFLRVADTVRSVSDLDTLAFWLMPHVARCEAVLLDTWGICSILLRTIGFLGLSHPIHFDCLAAHPNSSPAALKIVLEQLSGHQAGKLLVVSSVTSSGRLEVRVRETLRHLRGEQARLDFVNIFRFLSSDIEQALCTIPTDVETSGESDCHWCKKNSVAIGVDPALYYLKNVEEHPVMIPGTVFATANSFLNSYSHIADRLLSVHMDDIFDGNKKHHAFFVDTKVLMRESLFSEKFKSRLEQLPTPGVIIHPPHETACEFARKRCTRGVVEQRLSICLR